MPRTTLRLRVAAKDPLVALSADAPGYNAVVASKTELRTVSINDKEASVSLSLSQSSRSNRQAAFKCVKWGYGQNANKVFSGQTNGTVTIWNLEAIHASQPEQVKSEHGRAVNQVTLAGQAGFWLISAGQDGFIRLWDTRTSGPSSLNCHTPSDACRDIALHPVDAPPTVYQICSVGESGLMYSWDIRNSFQSLERIQAHLSGATCLDWRTAGPDCTWIATGALDNTVKVWQHTSAGFLSRPIYTLATGHPTASIAWRPQRQNDLLITPLHTTASFESESSSSTLGSETDADHPGASWLSETELWNVDSPYTYKSVLRSGDGTTAGATWVDPDTLWTTHRNSGLFVQRLLHEDMQKPLASLPRSAVAWSIRGELGFSTAPDSKRQQDLATVDVEPTVLDVRLLQQSRKNLNLAHADVERVTSADLALDDFMKLAKLFRDDHVESGTPIASTSKLPEVASIQTFPTYRYRSPDRRPRDPHLTAEYSDTDSDEVYPLMPPLDEEGQLLRLKRPQLLQSLPPKAYRSTERTPSRLRSDSAPPVKRDLAHALSTRSHVDRYSSTDDEGAEEQRPKPSRQRLVRNVSNSSSVTARPSRSKTRKTRMNPSRDNSSQLPRRQGLREHKYTKLAAEFNATWKDSIEDVLGLAVAEMVASGYFHWTMRLLGKVKVNLDDSVRQRMNLAHLEILRRLELHVPAAEVRKAIEHETSEASTTFHVACGTCNKAILEAPFGYCQRCASWADVCAVCHRRGSTLFCPLCGHSAHQGCLSQDITESPLPSIPSTPNLASIWSWLDGKPHGGDPECPSGCGHSGCCLGNLT